MYDFSARFGGREGDRANKCSVGVRQSVILYSPAPYVMVASKDPASVSSPHLTVL